MTCAVTGAYKEAVDAYTRAINANGSSDDAVATTQLPPNKARRTVSASADEHRDASHATAREMAALHSNRAAAHERLGSSALALQDGVAARELAPDWPKAHLRRGLDWQPRSVAGTMSQNQVLSSQAGSSVHPKRGQRSLVIDTAFHGSRLQGGHSADRAASLRRRIGISTRRAGSVSRPYPNAGEIMSLLARLAVPAAFQDAASAQSQITLHSHC